MQRLCLAEVKEQPRDRALSYSRLNAVLFALLLTVISAVLLWYAANKHWTAGYYLAGVVAFFLALTHRFVTARFRSSNWLVHMNDAGLYIQFRSYLNYHLPTEDLTVVFINYQEISSARLIRELVRVPDSQGRTATEILRYIELELVGSTKTLEEALQSEIGEPVFETSTVQYFAANRIYETCGSPPILAVL